MKLCVVLCSFVVLPLSVIAVASPLPSSPKVIDVHVIVNPAPTAFTGAIIFSGNSALPNFTRMQASNYSKNREFYGSTHDVQYLVDQGYTTVAVSLQQIDGKSVVSSTCVTKRYTIKSALPLTLTINAYQVSGQWVCNIN